MGVVSVTGSWQMSWGSGMANGTHSLQFSFTCFAILVNIFGHIDLKLKVIWPYIKLFRNDLWVSHIVRRASQIKRRWIYYLHLLSTASFYSLDSSLHGSTVPYPFTTLKRCSHLSLYTDSSYQHSLYGASRSRSCSLSDNNTNVLYHYGRRSSPSRTVARSWVARICNKGILGIWRYRRHGRCSGNSSRWRICMHMLCCKLCTSCLKLFDLP